MAEVIRMPRLSDTMEEGNIVGWNIKVGDKVEVGDVLAEVETDKATMDLESFHDGVLLYIGIEEGPVPVNGVLAVIGEEGEDFAKALEEDEKAHSSQESQEDSTEESKEEKSEEQSSASKDQKDSKESSGSMQSDKSQEKNSSDSRIKASPLAKRMAEDKGIDLSKVEGSGDNGRIVKRDIEEYKESAPTKSGSRTVALPNDSDFEYGSVPVSQMRKVIAKRLGESKFTAPHFYLTLEINMGKMMEARKALNANREQRISFNDIIVKAVAMALRKHPAVNSSWRGDSIMYNEEINIGVAVAIPDGLLVPVIQDTDLKSLTQINREVRELAGLAKNKRLAPEQMQGNTFTISNLGMYPIEEFTAIINPPDACILAVGTIVKKPIVQGDQIVVGNMMKVTLSCDHRVVDGATGSEFLVTLKNMLQEPLGMLM